MTSRRSAAPQHRRLLDGDEGRSAAKALLPADEIEGPINLVLTDIVMPEMNGCDLLDELRERRPERRLLLMSGYSDHAMRQHRFPVGDQQLLEKPFTSTELVRKVRQVLDAKLNAGDPRGGPIRRVVRSRAVGTRRRRGSDGAHQNRSTGLPAHDLLREQRAICLHAPGSGHDVTYP